MAAKTKKTRNSVSCPVFGSPGELSGNVLPTYGDIMKFYVWTKNKLKISADTKEPTFPEIGQIVSVRVEEIWTRGSISIVSHSRVLQLLRSYHDKYMNRLKPFKERQGQQSYKNRLQSFKEEGNCKLFDIAACKCELTKCSCVKVRKVPVNEQNFLADQRTTRLMIISSTVDRANTKKALAKQKRQLAEASRAAKLRQSGENNLVNELIVSSESEESEKEYDDDFDINSPMNEPCSTQTPVRLKVDLPSLAMACDRHGISDRAAAALASAVLENFGLISPKAKVNVIDKNKIRRARQRKRSILQQPKKSHDATHSLFFDGRKDHTIINAQKGSKWYRRMVVEEHISLIEEPGSKYLGHVTPASGTSENIKQSLINFLRQKYESLDTFLAIGCDGTNVNTGHIGGIIRLMEEELNKPLQWLICQLHANELPLRHLLIHLDGVTSGPRAFTGLIGKAMTACEKQPIVAFIPIESDLPLMTDVDDLSTDQQYLYDICDAVSKVFCSIALSRRNPGALSHSRWLTAANRLFRLYISTKNPSENLVLLATYILKVYAQMWFRIKSKPSCTDGARHVFQMIYKSRYLSKEVKAVIDSVIQRNGYFAHPENLILAMLNDERKHIRELAIRRILRARSEQCGLRKFRIPKINFLAGDYIDLIDWQNTPITEPPLLTNTKVTDLELFVASGDVPVIDFPKYPCHTQSVERCVKLVTEASAAVCGLKSRDGFICVRLESRQIMPSFNTKAEYRTA